MQDHPAQKRRPGNLPDKKTQAAPGVGASRKEELVIRK